MLTKLLPEQISKFWDIIKYAVEESLPPVVGESPNKMNNILMSCLNGTLEVWASYERSEEGTRFEGLMITSILYDKSSQTKNLLIYCIYGYNKVDKQSWYSGLTSLLKYAKSKNCNQIVAYTDVPMLVDLVKSLGGEARYTFVSFNVKELYNEYVQT